MKILLLLFFAYYYLFSETNFKETRYISAFDIEQYKYGNISTKDQILTLTYTKPKSETITYYKDKLVIKNTNSTKKYTFSKYPNLQYMGLLLKAILNNQYTLLDELFIIKKDKNITTIQAKSIINNTITSIEVIKQKTIIKTIIIYMSNKDKITIETIN
jgi:hypothetical protein